MIRGRTTGAAASVAGALALMVPATALAGPPEQSGVVERAPEWSAPLFWDGELIVLVGPPIEQGCLGEGFHTPVTTTVSARGGSTMTHYTDIDQVWVFDDEDVDHPLDWLLGLACPAVWGGGTPPTPLAHGEGTVIVNWREDTDGVVHGNQRFAGQVTTAGGDRAHLSVVGAGFDQFPDRITYGG